MKHSVWVRGLNVWVNSFNNGEPRSCKCKLGILSSRGWEQVVKHSTLHTRDLWNGPSLNGGLLPLSCYVVMFSPLVPVWLCRFSWLAGVSGLHFDAEINISPENRIRLTKPFRDILYCNKFQIRIIRTSHAIYAELSTVRLPLETVNIKDIRKAMGEFRQIDFDRSGTTLLGT